MVIKLVTLYLSQQELGQMHLEPRTIVERDLKAGHLDSEPVYIIAIWRTLQVCGYKKMEEMNYQH
jgi:hypothetical protein